MLCSVFKLPNFVVYMTTPKRPNVILLVLDSVRADHVSCYGYKRLTTPTIDKIAQEGILFSQVITAAPWTLPSHASLFTGLFPTEHGVSQENTYLSETIPTLAQLLNQAGYRTVGFSNNPWVDKSTGLDRGFKEFFGWRNFRPTTKTNFLEKISRKLQLYKGSMAENTIKQMLSWIKTYSDPKSAPFFLFANFMETHIPYSVPRQFLRKFSATEFNWRTINQDEAKYITGTTRMSTEDLEKLALMYDSALAYLDSEIGRFLTSLDKLGILENTLLIITSDHGENLGEHGLISHVLCLYDTLLRVPLVMRHPSLILPGTIVNNQIQLHYLFSTILQVAQSMVAKDEYQGSINLLNQTDKGQVNQGYTFAEYNHPVLTANRFRKFNPDFDNPQLITALKCVRSSQYKYIWSERGQDEFYELEGDPEETHNLIQDSKASLEIDKMKCVLTMWEGTLVKTYQQPMIADLELDDAALTQRLKDLGYF